jgi:hypothetical protein
MSVAPGFSARIVLTEKHFAQNPLKFFHMHLFKFILVKTIAHAGLRGSLQTLAGKG